VYYHFLASSLDGRFIWHPFRNYLFSPVDTVTTFSGCKDRLVEVFLAGLICVLATEQKAENDITACWAHNVDTIFLKRNFKKKIPRESDPEKAARLAADLVHEFGLQVPPGRIGSYLMKAEEVFRNLLGAAAGLCALAATGSHAQAMVAHSTTELGVRPFTERVTVQIADSIAKSRRRMTRKAREGVERLFSVTTEDLG
jgi:hypothetical protein